MASVSEGWVKPSAGLGFEQAMFQAIVDVGR